MCSCPVTRGKRPRSGARAVANVIFEGTRGGTGVIRERMGQVGGKEAEVTELEFDPWCSRWDAILFIVLIISEYIVRTRHAAPRSRIREIYAIETTPSPPLRRPLALNHPVPPPVCASLSTLFFFHCRFLRRPVEGIRTRVLTRVICAASK